MAEFIVKKAGDVAPVMQQDPIYDFIYYKKVLSKDGSEVEIEDRHEHYTLRQLNNQKTEFEKRIDEIQAKIDAIEGM